MTNVEFVVVTGFLVVRDIEARIIFGFLVVVTLGETANFIDLFVVEELG